MKSSLKRIPFHLATAWALLALSSPTLDAQAPKNAVLVGTTAMYKLPGTTGIFYVTLPTSKNAGGKIQALSGKLPPELTVKPGQEGGAWSLLRRPSDGTIFVGDAAGAGGWCHVHILRMAGLRITSYRSVRVGSVPPNIGRGTVQGLALLPDGRVLVAGGYPFLKGPLSGGPIGILDDKPKTPTVTPVKLSNTLAQTAVQGLALSPDGRTAYLTVAALFPILYPSILYAIPIPTQQTQTVKPKLLHTWKNRYVSKMTVDRNGVIYTTAVDAASKNPVAGTIEEIRIVNGKTIVRSTTASLNVAGVAPRLERATGKIVLVSAFHPKTVKNNSVLMSDLSGKISLLAGPPKGGWGMPFSTQILNSFETYGEASPTNKYTFVDFPNPGGLPEVGNKTFSMTVESITASPIASFMVLGASQVNVRVLGLQLLTTPILVLPMSWAKGRATLPLPIPNETYFRSKALFAQSIHIQSSIFSASNGLRIEIQ